MKMDRTSMFTLTYGLFIAGVEWEGKKNGCIINTAVQTTSDPVRMNVTMMKDNYTTELIRKKGSLVVSVLSIDCPLDIVQSFGMRSGRDHDKFEGIDYKTDRKGNPYVEDNTIAFMSLDVSSILDLGSHYLFICEVSQGSNTGGGQPMTYADYRNLKRGKPIDKSQGDSDDSGGDSPAYVCTVCHYAYDGDIPFEDLGDDYKCPVCSQPKSAFLADS